MQREVLKLSRHKNVLPKRKKVAAYVRASSGKDAMMHSLSAQISYYSKLIQDNPNWQYCGVYADEAKTGTKDSRPEFQRLLNDCKQGKINMIITKGVSRFARNTLTVLKTVRELKKLGIDVYFEKENIHSLSEEGELMLTLLSSFAQEESEIIVELMKSLIYENSRKVMNQDEYNKKYDSYTEKHEKIKSELSKLEDKKQDLKVRRDKIKMFIANLKSLNEVISEFDERLWCMLLDKVVVREDENIEFKFRNSN